MAQFEEFIIRLKDQFSSGLRDADDALDDARESVDDLNDGFETLKRTAAGIAVALGVDAIIDATKEFSKLQNAVMAYTGGSSDAAADLISQAGAIADTYDAEASEVLQAANVLTKQMGGTMESNLALITEGFRKGANVNGEFLEQLREYPAQFRAAGLDASQSIALISDAAKKGVYSDKAADTIKEMTLSLREMTQIQRDALTNIGVDANKVMADISSGAKTPFEAVQMIVGEMEKFDVAAQQTVIADVFKGAGEDAGIQFIKSLKDINFELSDIEANGTGFNDAMFQLNTIVNDVKTTFMNEFIPILSQFATFLVDNVPLLKGIAAGLITVAAALGIMKVATIAQTIATMGLNGVLLANPIGLVVAAIAALVAGLVYAYNEFETFRKIVDGVWKGLKIVGSWIADWFVAQWNMASAAVGQFAEWFRSIYPTIKNVITAAGKFILKYHPVALLIRGLKQLFPEFFDDLTKRIKKAWEWLGEQFAKIKSFFGFGDDDGELKVDANHTVDESGSGTDASAGFNPTGSLTGGGMISAATSAQNMKSGLSSMSNSAPKQFNINIDKLIDTFTVSTETIGQSRDQIRDIVLETLLTAVNDVQTAID